MKSLIPVFFLLAAASGSGQGIYDLKVNSFQEGVFDFQHFKGRVVMIVNVASSSEKVRQLDELQELHDRFRDSGLVIIAIPSDDFGKEKRDKAQVKEFYKKYSFLVATKAIVKGQGAAEVFSWLGDKKQNGIIDSQPKSDFEKYIINREGRLVAFFTSDVSPLDPVIVETFRKN